MHRSLLAIRTFTAAALVVILAACGGGEPSADTTDDQSTAPGSAGAAQAAEAVDVCALLTDAQVEEALGIAVTSKEPGGGQGFATGACRWVLESDSTVTNEFTVSVLIPGGRSRFDILAADMPPVPDVGDDAYLQGDSVWAVTGDAVVILDFPFLYSAVDEPGSAVLPLVEIVLSQL